MGSICCLKDKNERVSTEEKEDDQVNAHIGYQSYQMNRPEIPKDRREKKTTIVSKEDEFTKIFLELSDSSPLDHPLKYKDHKVTLKAAGGCVHIISIIKDQKRANNNNLQKMKSSGIISALLSLLESEHEEIRQWATKTLYKLLKVIEKKNLAGDELIEGARLIELFEILLSDTRDYTKYFALKIIVSMIKSYQLPKTFLNSAITNVVNFQRPVYLLKYLEIVKAYMSTKKTFFEFDQTSEMLNDIDHTLVFLKQFKRSQNISYYYRMVFVTKDIKYLLEKSNAQKPILSEKKSLSKRKNDGKNRIAEQMESLDRETLFNSITDQKPMKLYNNRSDLFPVSCVGTQAVIYMTQVLMGFESTPSDLLYNDYLPQSLLKNLQSDKRDLVQYTIVMLSHIYSQPQQEGVSENTKEEITLILTKYLNDDIEEIRYTCGEIIRNFYIGNPLFIQFFTKTFKKMVKNSVSFDTPKYFVYNLMNIQELMTDSSDELIPLGIEILKDINIVRILELRENAWSKSEYSSDFRAVRDDFSDVKLFLKKVKRQIPVELKIH